MKRATARKKIQTRDTESLKADTETLQQPHAHAFKPDADNCKSVAILAKGLSDENRLRILMCLIGSRKSVSRIVEEVGLSQPLVSHHLKELKRCLLVDIKREGPFIYYGLSDSRVLDVVKTLNSVAASLVAARKTL
jgi:DNA-binding transcriptional ArsR family regulator